MNAHRPLLPMLCLSALAVTAACSADSTAASGNTSTSSSRSTLVVLAAASLQETFTVIAEDFESEHPGTDVSLQFGPSSGLATQIVNGAPADVFASASAATMDVVVTAGMASAPETFARNEMAIALPADNTGAITSLGDLEKPGVKIAVCADAVPCGVGAATVFANAELTLDPVSEDVDVKAVLTKVRMGEVDAGLVYRTDVRAASEEVTSVAIPEDVNARTSYPIAAIAGSARSATATAFIEYVSSADGQKVLQDAGFTAP